MATVAQIEYPRAQIIRWMIVEVVRWVVHVGAVVGAFLVECSWPVRAAFAVLYLLGAFGVTLCYHRYFTRRSCRSNRWFQAVRDEIEERRRAA